MDTDDESARTEGDASGWAEAQVELKIAGHPFRMQLRAPTQRVPASLLLPLFQGFTDTIVHVAVEATEADGKRISCRSGCGACCRQLVPLSKTEAHQIKAVVDAMPEPRRSDVLARFRDAGERVRRAGLMAALKGTEEMDRSEARPLALSYFHLGIPCPFLEEESCSIHEHRPLVCREYLVTSPPENCNQPSADTIRRISIPGRASIAVGQLGTEERGAHMPWIPLILALDWIEESGEGEPQRPGTEVVMEFFARLSRQAPAPPPEEESGQ